MGGKKPTSPRIIPGKPPSEERPGTKFEDLPPEEKRRLMDMCPDPNMHILMADGSQKKAGDLVVGDLVKTYHEESLELGNYKVEYVDVINNSKKIKLIFDESEIICSTSHKFYVDGSWKSAEDMVIGDKVSSKKLISVENIEDGDVIHITIEDAHTYICEGLLSHNKGLRPRFKDRGRRRRSFAEDARSGNLPNIDFTPQRPRTGVDIMPIPPDFVGRPRKPKRPSKPSRSIRRGRLVGRRMPPRPRPRPRPPIDDLGSPPEREVPIPKERLPRITRESDPRGPAPFAPNERAEAKDRFFERMFDKADERRQQSSMEREERREVRQARNEERRARRNQPREINVGNERRQIRKSMMEERAARRMQPGEIDVGGEIDINAERGGRGRRRRRDFTRRRTRMMGGRRGRSMEERAAFRDRYVSSLRGGFFS
jgi:hypothetical protein